MSVSENDVGKLNRILQVATEDKDFRSHLLSDVKGTIDRQSTKLGFGSSELSNDVTKAIGSMTGEELDALVSIRNKLSSEGLLKGLSDLRGGFLF